MKRRRSVSSLLLTIVATFALACEQVEPASVAPGRSAAPSSAMAGGTLRYGQSGDVSALDPWNADGSSLLVTRQIFETLVDYEPAGFGITPKLATKWDTSVDGKTWTFTLREGVRFHDGTPLDGDAVVLNFDRGRSTKHELRPSKPIADNFASYGRMWGGHDDASIIVGVEATSATTVVFTLRNSFGPFLANLAMPAFALVSPRSMRDDKDGFMLPGTKGVAGTGPFTFTRGAWLKGQSITLERNASYWDKGKPNVDRVSFRIVADTPARIGELKAGTVDAIRDFAPADVATIKGDPNLRIISRPAFTVAYIGLNHTLAPFDNPSVRRAVAMALNKRAILGALYAGEGQVASQFLVPGLTGYDDSIADFYRYDEAGARRALAKGGYPSGFTTELWYLPESRPSYPDSKKIAEAFAADLAKIGIRADLRTKDVASYRADARNSKLALWLHDWTGESGDPDSFLGALFHPVVKDGRDPIPGGGWSNPLAWDLLRKAQADTDSSKRAELYKQVSKLIQQDVVAIPTFHLSQSIAATRKVAGLIPHPTGGETLASVSLGK